MIHREAAIRAYTTAIVRTRAAYHAATKCADCDTWLHDHDARTTYCHACVTRRQAAQQAAAYQNRKNR